MVNIQGNTFVGHMIDSRVKEVWIIEGFSASGRKRLNHMWPWQIVYRHNAHAWQIQGKFIIMLTCVVSDIQLVFPRVFMASAIPQDRNKVWRKLQGNIWLQTCFFTVLAKAIFVEKWFKADIKLRQNVFWHQKIKISKSDKTSLGGSFQSKVSIFFRLKHHRFQKFWEKTGFKPIRYLFKPPTIPIIFEDVFLTFWILIERSKKQGNSCYNHYYGVNTPSVKRQGKCQIETIVYMVTLENQWPTDFQASRFIPMDLDAAADARCVHSFNVHFQFINVKVLIFYSIKPVEKFILV